MRTLEVLCADVRFGGCQRALMSVENRCKLLDSCSLILSTTPPEGLESTTREIASILREARGKASLAGVYTHSRILEALGPLRLVFNLAPLTLIKLQLMEGSRREVDADIVISHHETPEPLHVACMLAEELGARSLAILQLPPFYGDERRARRLAEGVLLFYELAGRYAGLQGFLGKLVYEVLLSRLHRNLFKRMIEGYLSRFHRLVAVSPSIPIEMGDPWSDRVLPMTYWAGVDVKRVELLRRLRVKHRGRSRESTAVFPARLSPTKGLGDLLLAWRLVRRWSRRRVKLVVMGGGTSRRALLLSRIAKGLGLEDSFAYLGYVRGEDYWRIRASALLTIYPSHEDSYSYTVFESLMLGVPVVAYDIPALRLNYGPRRGLYLVREGDIEALAQKTVELIEKPEDVDEEPPFKNWSEIALEELSVIKAALRD